MPNFIKFHLIKEGGKSLDSAQDRPDGLQTDLKKIIDYLITFVGEISVKRESPNLVKISYAETPLQAALKVDKSQITLTCEKNDNLTVNLLKNVTKNIGYRIFNPQNGSFMVNDPYLMDLTTIKVEPQISKIFKDYQLTPLFKHRNALVFFARDKKGKIHLTNRHLLEHLMEDKEEKKHTLQKDFSVEVAPDIGRFIALYDRGLIPNDFYATYHNPTKVLNLSGFNVDGFEKRVFIESVFFVLDASNQAFKQLGLTKKGMISRSGKLKSYLEKALKESKLKNKLMAVKVARDINYDAGQKGKLIPRLTLSVFMDEKE